MKKKILLILFLLILPLNIKAKTINDMKKELSTLES